MDEKTNLVQETPPNIEQMKKILFNVPRAPKKPKAKRKSLNILRVLMATTGGRHSWVETDKGIFRKNNNNINI